MGPKMRLGRWKNICSFMMLSVAPLASVWAKMPEKRSVQTSAICLDEFSWMDNSLNQSPCSVAAWLLSQCAGGNWNLPALPNASFHYQTPGALDTPTSPCSCAWASYNTLQACAFCQGPSFQSAIFGWDGYKQNCTGNFSSGNTPWPQADIIPAGTAIPFWAEKNPEQWEDAIFNPSAAQELASENKPDLTQANRNKKSTPVGAIVGGVVGGVVAVAAIGLILFRFFWRRRSYKHLSLGTSSKPFRPMHGRSISDYSTQKYSEYTGSPSPGLPTSTSASSGILQRPPFHQRNGSSHSIPGQQSIMSISYTSHSPDYGTQVHAAATPAVGVAMGVMPLNTPSTTYAAARATGSPPVAYGHAHTLSNHSNISSIPSTHERSISHSSDTPDGAISPFLLTAAEQSAPTHREKSGHTSTGTNLSPPQMDSPPAVVGSTPAARRAERRNPPAYSPVSSPDEQMFDSSAGGMSFSQASVDAHAAQSQGLSGTTLQDSAEPTVASVNEEHEEEEGHHGFPADRKI